MDQAQKQGSGFAFPKEEREALVRSEPGKFMMPGASDLRNHWVEVRLEALDVLEMRELVLDASRMVMPKSVCGPLRRSLSRGRSVQVRR